MINIFIYITQGLKITCIVICNYVVDYVSGQNRKTKNIKPFFSSPIAK